MLDKKFKEKLVNRVTFLKTQVSKNFVNGGKKILIFFSVHIKLPALIILPRENLRNLRNIDRKFELVQVL